LPAFIICCKQLNSQQNAGSGSSNAGDKSKDISNVLSAYLDKSASPLYYGVEHFGYSSKIKGFAYWGSADRQQGSVLYDGILYTNVSIKYDLVADEVIVRHPNNYFGVTLATEKVNAFSIGDQPFVYVPQKNEYSLKAGFYEVAVTGTITLLVKETKKVHEEVYNEVNSSFVDSKEFYVLVDGKSVRITNESSFTSLLGDKSRKVRDYMKDKDISFKDAREFYLKTAVVYYNQLP
jgi:hypothetical protein